MSLLIVFYLFRTEKYNSRHPTLTIGLKWPINPRDETHPVSTIEGLSFSSFEIVEPFLNYGKIEG